MKTLHPEFVEFIPEFIEDGIIYITIKYRTVVHNCVCGCGNKVVTPISPTDWKLTFDGKSVSLSPSIGNWNFACKSHYWVKNNKICHARKWSDFEIELGRQRDFYEKKKYFKKKMNK